jgi:PAS domain S-box-containing protein
MRGKTIVVSDPSQLSEEAGALREVLVDSGVRSLVALPLRIKEKSIATLTFATVRNQRDWDPDVVQGLRTIANIFCSALERKQAEEAVHDSRNRLNGVVESAMDAIIALDSAQNVIVFNATAARMFGYTVEDALGKPLDHFIPARFRIQHKVHVSSFAEAGVTNHAMGRLGPLSGLRANGEEFPIEASISQVTTDAGKMLTVIVRDITEREWAFQQLRKSHELNAAVLESLRNHVAVLDAEGIVTAATNRRPEFAAVAGISLMDLEVGSSFFET